MRVSFGLLGLCALLGVSSVAAQNSWVPRAPMPFPRSDFTAASVKGLAYMLGGCSGLTQLIKQGDFGGPCTEVTNHFSSYDLTNDKWQTLAVAPNNRTRYAVASTEDQIYYVGGRGLNDEVIAAVDIFTISTGAWSSITPAGDHHLTSDQGAWINNGNLYVTGGYDGNYDPLASTVSAPLSNIAGGFSNNETIANMPLATGDLGLVGPVLNKVFVFGGYSSDICQPLTQVKAYDIATNTWSVVAPLRIGRADMGFTSIGSKIYAIAGQTSPETCGTQAVAKSIPVDDVEQFDVADGVNAVWVKLGDLADERMRFTSASVGSTIINFGGQGTQTGTSEENIKDDANTDGYYPVLGDVYAVDANTSFIARPSTSSTGMDLGAASNTATSAVALIVALVSAVMLA